jgi:cell division protease FtsH
MKLPRQSQQTGPAQPTKSPDEKKRQRRYALWYLIFAILMLAAVQFWWGSSNVESIPYSQFVQLLDAGQVTQVEVSDTTITGTLSQALPSGKTQFTTIRVDPDIEQLLEAHNVQYSGTVTSDWLALILSWIVPIGLLVVVWVFFIRRMAGQGVGGLTAIGKSRAKVYVETDTKVTFADVAGVEEAEAELEEIVTFLKNPESYGRLGARVPKGILLIGPPGTGKTLLARAVAGEAGVPFFSISGSEFVELFVGVGAARVRDLFEQARAAAPCIIFIDELDALGRSRSAGQLWGGYDEKEQTLNQLLAELDGFDPTTGVILLAATNRPEILDPALLRAGRFDRQVLVDRPDREGRLEILKVHIGKVKLAPNVDLDTVAGLTTGFTGADLANLINEAALLATRRKADSVNLDDFTAAIERIVAGLEKKSRVLSAEERKRVAHHEMGHALVAASLPGVDPVLKVSIIPRGVGALGYTIQRPTEDRFLLGVTELKNRVAVLLGGRAAEQLVFNEISTGAADDLQRATQIATEMVTRYGMDETLGHRVYAPPGETLLGSTPMPAPFGRRDEVAEETEREIDLAVRRLVQEAFDRAIEILTKRRDELNAGAKLLLEKETITADDFPALQRRAGQGPMAA